MKRILFIVILITTSNLSRGQESTVLSPDSTLFRFDLRTMVMDVHDLEKAIKQNEILIDFTKVVRLASLQGIDLGFNKTHAISGPMTVIEVMDLMEKKFPDSRLFDLGYSIFVVQKDIIWRFYFQQIPADFNKLANTNLNPGDIIVVIGR